MKILDAKAAVDKEWEKLEKLPAWQLTTERNKRRVILEAQKEKRTAHFCVIDGHLSCQKCGVGAEVSKSTKAASSYEVTL